MMAFIRRLSLMLSLLLFSPFSGAAAPSQDGRMIYRTDLQYDSTHWALSILKPADPMFVARVTSHGAVFVIKLNPTDARGYRVIVALEDQDMASTLNRPYTLRERLGLSAVLAVCQNVYESFGIIAQIEVLGNNAHTFNPDSGDTLLGQAHEPSFLHGHVIGRGNPTYEYVPGVPLRGPIPGELFEHRNQKIQWTGPEMEIVGRTLSKQFWLRRLELGEFGVIVKDFALFAEHELNSECSAKLVGDE